MKLIIVILSVLSFAAKNDILSSPKPVTCLCELNEVCEGSRGGKYCITKTGTKKYIYDSSKDNCQCATPVKRTVNWCTGAKGGQYCITAKGNKSYKPKL